MSYGRAGFLLYAVMTFLSPSPLRAAGTAAAAFLNMPVGGRAAALGGAYSASAADAYAPLWNPAGLDWLPSTQIAGMHLDHLGLIGYELLSFAHPLAGGGGVGAATQFLHPDKIKATDASGADVGTYSSYFAAHSVAYGRKVSDRLSLGASLKLVDARIDDVSGRALGGDLGALYRPDRRLALAAVAANLGGKLRFLEESQNLPDTYRLALLFSPSESWQLSAEGAYARADGAFPRAGAEWRPLPALAVRLGFHGDTARGIPGLSGLTTGFGIEFLGQRFDYAWVPMGDLGQTQHFSVQIAFGKTRR